MVGTQSMSVEEHKGRRKERILKLINKQADKNTVLKTRNNIKQ